MPTGTRVSVEGLDLVRRNLRAIDKALPRELTKIHKAVATPVADTARGKVRSKSGRLARSIRPGGTQKAATIKAGVGLRPYPYAPINHYGGYPGAYAGNPFLTDAMADDLGQTLGLYDRLLFDFVEKVWVDS